MTIPARLPTRPRPPFTGRSEQAHRPARGDEDSRTELADRRPAARERGAALRCESLERSVQVLKKEGKWTYSSPDIPTSHWIEQGHDDAYANDATSCVRSIKSITQSLRSDSVDEVTVRGASASPILSDNKLNPHWEQLANAMQFSECIPTINLWNVQLDQSTLQMIEASLRQKGIARFDLAHNQFLGGEGVKFAVDVLKSNRSVEHFCWEDNSFHSTQDACDLIDAVLEHPEIYELDLTRSLNGNIILLQRLFSGALGTDTLLDVNLSGNQIRTNGDRCIPNFLSTNPPLEMLDLEGNQLTDDDAIRITAIKYSFEGH